MPDRIARNRIIVGSGNTRKVIEPGTRFKTEDYGIDAAELKRFDETGVVRKLRDQSMPAAPAGPREAPVVEGRTEMTGGDATSQPASPAVNNPIPATPVIDATAKRPRKAGDEDLDDL